MQDIEAGLTAEEIKSVDERLAGRHEAAAEPEGKEVED